jgi:hypothetical protein
VENLQNMKILVFCGILLLGAFPLCAQKVAIADSVLLGQYTAAWGGTKFTFNIYEDHDKLMLEVVGQGHTGLVRLAPLTYEPLQIRPVGKIEFLKDSLGRIDRLLWTQKGVYTMTRIGGDPGGYTGDWSLAANPYRIFHVTERDGMLWGHVAGEPEKELSKISGDHFEWKAVTGVYQLQYQRDKQGRLQSLVSSGNDVLTFVRSGQAPRMSNRINGFTHADSLQGALTPLRTCYDVLFYDLAMRIVPETKSIQGSNMIRFRTVQDFDRLQVDLHANLTIDSIMYHGVALPYTRDCNAVFVQFPGFVRQGSIDSMTIFYGGVPLEPEMLALQGGIFWLKDFNNNMWIESVCQGVGANVWWPCKDHLSDRADSMRFTVTVPSGLAEISNGKLLDKRELPGGQTRYVWYVHYPVPTYDVVVNLGDYVHFSDVYLSGRDSVALNFYCLRFNEDFARRFFADTKRMLALYEKDFGPYPFPRDGYTVMESIWPMEHHAAVGIGSMNAGAIGKNDSVGLRETFWHESAHEWWGNSVGCRDYADMWMNEAFASYASEFINNDVLVGREKALARIHDGKPENKAPVIGVYDVNHFHMGDMYQKGELMLHTLRTVIDNDSLWFGILQGIQSRYRYQAIGTEDIVDYFNKATGKDYTYLFDQYLRYPGLPILALAVQNEKTGVHVRYRWEANVNDFHMPVKVTTSTDGLGWIYPTTDWQTMEIKGMALDEFKVDTANFYVEVRMAPEITGH